MKIRHLPVRLTVGAFFLNSGLGKFQLDEESAAGMQEMAATGVPQVKQLKPAEFGKALAVGETALGVALIAPFVPAWIPALGLGAFSVGVLSMYLKTPGMTQEDGIRPTADGTSLAKDVWLTGIAASLLLDEVTVSSRARRKEKVQNKAEKMARREAKKLASRMALDD